ncbi:MAG: dihydroorotate dehydrogenase [Acidobacteria bacterium]|nr:dihydroorotate dehydrogenase [Acidobacteriota bacterium]
MAGLEVSIGSLRLRNPVLLASGCVGYGEEIAQFVDLSALGGIVVKGLYMSPRIGNPPPRIWETPSGMLNSIGLQGIGIHRFVRERLPALRQGGATVIVNVCGETDEEYEQVTRVCDEADGIHATELNISCPNIQENGRCPGMSQEHTYSLISRVRKASSKPLIVKLSPNVTDVAAIATSAEQGGADAVSLINTVLGMSIDTETGETRTATGMGGLSGPAIRPIAVRMVYQVSHAVRIPVIGIGGICDARDAIEFFMAGASAVQVGTANFMNPVASMEVLAGIKSYLARKGKKLNEIIGTCQIGRVQESEPG